MSVYCISDIHGNLQAFEQMMELIHFSQQDMLYVIGDVIDRGPYGIELLQKLMRMPNVQVMLGNHELMMREYLGPGGPTRNAMSWDYNGNQYTRSRFQLLNPWEQEQLIDFLYEIPDTLDVTVGEKEFCLVHGFPGENTRQAVWGRPRDTEIDPPLPGRQLIIGHTPVPLLLCPTDSEMQRYFREKERTHTHNRILHAKGFIDIDCGCGHNVPGSALACLRLNDMEEFYISLFG